MEQPPTARDLELALMPSIASQLPVLFANGTRVVTFTPECARCSKGLEGDAVRGAITRPLPRLAVIEAVGICHECSLLTRYLMRVYDDLTALHPTARGWQFRQPRRVSLLARVVRAVMNFLGRDQRPN